MRFKDYCALVEHVLPEPGFSDNDLVDELGLYERVMADYAKLSKPVNDFQKVDRFSLRLTTESQIKNYQNLGHSVWETD